MSEDLAGPPTWLRTAQLWVACGAGAILVANAAFGWWQAHLASPILAGGHGEHLLREIRGAHPPTGEALDVAAIDRLLERLAPEGLHCLTIFEPDLRVRARRGDCVSPPANVVATIRAAGPGGPPRRIGGRLLMIHAPPPLPGAPPMPAVAQPPPPTDSPHPWPLAIEYDAPPVAALWAATYGTTFASLVAALVLVGATVLHRRLATRADALRDALARDQQLAALGEASAVLAHELRNPLSSIKGNAQLMAEQVAGDERARDRAELLVREALRLEALCEQLLSFVRANRVEAVDADPAAILRDAAASVDGTRIELDTAHAPARWRLDPLWMHQVLANLLQNAVQASPPTARSRACVRVQDRSLVYEVRDRGPGVAAGDVTRIFEPFHTTRVRGTGLGLAVARRVVELHGGRIDVRNHPDGGAVFRVRIPGT